MVLVGSETKGIPVCAGLSGVVPVCWVGRKACLLITPFIITITIIFFHLLAPLSILPPHHNPTNSIIEPHAYLSASNAALVALIKYPVAFVTVSPFSLVVCGFRWYLRYLFGMDFPPARLALRAEMECVGGRSMFNTCEEGGLGWMGGLLVGGCGEVMGGLKCVGSVVVVWCSLKLGFV